MKTITTKVATLAVAALTTLGLQAEKVIAINFNPNAESNESDAEYSISDADTLDLIDASVPGSAWTQVTGSSSSSAETSFLYYDTETSSATPITGMSMTWTSKNVWAWRNDAIKTSAYKYLGGYLDDGNGGRGTIAALAIYETVATVKDVACGSAYSISTANAFTEDIVNLTLDAGATLTFDEAPTRDFNVISEGTITLTGAGLSAESLTKLANKTGGFIFRIEDDLSAGAQLGYGAGTYSFKNAKVTTQYGADHKILVTEGDVLHLAEHNQADGRTSVSLDVQGGAVTIGKTGGHGSFWYGTGNATTYNQTGGTVTCTANGTGTSGSGNGLLLGWSSGLAAMNISGGTLDVSNSSLNFWSTSTTLNLSGGTVKAKGVFKGDGKSSGHKVVLSGTGTFELGSLGWSGVALDLAGGTLKAVDNATISSAITTTADATVAVETDKTLKLTGVSGDGVITKTGTGVLSVGQTRPALTVTEGRVEIVAASADIIAGVITLPIPGEKTAVTKAQIVVVDEAGAAVEVSSVTTDDTTVTIKLQTIPAITAESEDKTISGQNLTGKSGMLVIQGGATAEDIYTVTFDAEIPSTVSVAVNGYVAIVYGGDITALPLEQMTFESGADITVPTFNGTVPAGVAITTAEVSGTITNNGTLNVTGACKFTLVNNGTLNLKDGAAAEISASGQAVKGTVNIEKGATYVNESPDAIAYNGSTIVNVKGTLEMANNTRWTVGGSSQLNLYGGCTVTGTTEGEGAFDLYRQGEVIRVLPSAAEEGEESINTVTLEAKIRVRNSGSQIKIENGMFLNIAGPIGFNGSEGNVVTLTGAGKLTGTNTLAGAAVNLGTVNSYPARFVAASGFTSTLKWSSTTDGSSSICIDDSMEDPFVTVEPGADLKIDGKDFSGWNGGLIEHGWVVNNGTLTFAAGTGTRFWRDHIVMGEGATLKIDTATAPWLLYGGAGTAEACQLMLPEGNASIIAGAAGDNAVLYLGNNTSGGYGSNNNANKGAGISVGKDAVLTIAVPVKGNANDPITKWGEGSLIINEPLTDFASTINLKGGLVTLPAESVGKVTTDVAGMYVNVKENADGTKTCKLSARGLTISIR